MKIQDLSEVQVHNRKEFIMFLKNLGWRETKTHRDFESGEDYYIDAQLTKELANTSTVSLIQEYNQILFEAEFDDFVLRLSTEDCKILHSSTVPEELPSLSEVGDIENFLRNLLLNEPKYTIGVEDDFEPLSDKSIQEFLKLT